MSYMIPPETFWKYSLNELLDVLNAVSEEKKNTRKSQINDLFLVSNLITQLFARSMAGKKATGEPPRQWDYYPELFAEEKKRYEQAEMQNGLEENRNRRKAYAAEFNRRRRMQA